MESPSNKRSLPEDEDKFTVLSLASFDYSGGSNHNVRSRAMSPPVEEQQQQAPQQSDQHLSQQLVLPLPHRVQSIQTTTLPLQPRQPQSPLRLPLHYPVPVTGCSVLPLPLPPPPSTAAADAARSFPSPSSGRSRLNSGPESSEGKKGKNKIITPPFPWATECKAKVHIIDYLLQNEILTITGTVQCKRCERKYEMGFDLKEKFAEVCMFVKKQKREMYCRAPEDWNNPVLPSCMQCGQENSAKPIIEDGKKRSINWLFLWLGQWLGLCTINQLKYFCKQTGIHRTAGKDHLLYHVYIRIGNQLAPRKFDSL